MRPVVKARVYRNLPVLAGRLWASSWTERAEQSHSRVPAVPAPSSGQDPDAETAPSSSSSLQTGPGAHAQMQISVGCDPRPYRSQMGLEARGGGSPGVPLIVLWQSERLLMQGSSCYCDTLSTIPDLLTNSLSLTHTHSTESGSPHLKATGEIRGDGSCVCVCVQVT